VKPYYGHGISLRPEYYQSAADHPLPVPWVEVVSERFLALGGARAELLEKVRRECAVALHCTSLSIGSVDPLNDEYLRRVRALAQRTEPVWVSDHLAWSSLDGHTLELLPLPYNEECLEHVVRRVDAVRDVLGETPFLLENPSSYLEFTTSTMPEWDFLAEVCERTGCGILLDLNNLEVVAENHAFDPSVYLAGLPAESVWQIHLSGHGHFGALAIDTHEGPVPETVWSLYRQAVRRFGPVSTIIEWDTNPPPLPTLVDECHKAAAVEGELR
jgi:uncharacterized protein